MLGDNIKSLQKLPDNSIDSIVTDPPYGLSFMGKKWDYDVPSVEFWKEVYRVLKPGGHVLSFGGTRTYHRMVVNIEDAGFEIRDQIMWLYGSGFPKSHNIGKAVDKIQGNDREVVGEMKGAGSTGTTYISGQDHHDGLDKGVFKSSYIGTKGQSPYEGWGTALKPANEPICVARKPLSEKSVAENVLKWGTGGINIDGCRVEYKSDDDISGWNKKNYTEGETSSGFIDGLKN
jgi:site-specific DNA-methyltransferase (adenine-specific)